MRRLQHHLLSRRCHRRRRRRRRRNKPAKHLKHHSALHVRKHRDLVQTGERRKRVVLQRNLREEIGLPRTQAIARPRLPAAAAIAMIRRRCH